MKQSPVDPLHARFLDCAWMYLFAVEDKVDPAAHSGLIGKGCKAFGRKHPGTSMPPCVAQAHTIRTAAPAAVR
jgi:hypothetical protein